MWKVLLALSPFQVFEYIYVTEDNDGQFVFKKILGHMYRILGYLFYKMGQNYNDIAWSGFEANVWNNLMVFLDLVCLLFFFLLNSHQEMRASFAFWVFARSVQSMKHLQMFV